MKTLKAEAVFIGGPRPSPTRLIGYHDSSNLPTMTRRMAAFRLDNFEEQLARLVA